jgi:hypothetical protein
VARCGVVGSIGRIGADRSSAWICGFSSTANTAAATGGFRYSPTMSRIFSTRSGSGETLNSSCRQGLSPNARQISETVCRLIPCRAASARVDQCIVTDRAHRARARRVGQAFQPVGGEPVTPLRDRDPVTARLRRDRGVRPTLRTGQHDPRPQRQRLRRRRPPRPPLQRLPLLLGQHDRDRRPSHTSHHQAPHLGPNAQAQSNDQNLWMALGGVT